MCVYLKSVSTTRLWIGMCVCECGWVPVCLGAACVTGRVDAAFDCVYVVALSSKWC